jgi:hypothetical protein
VQSLPVPPADGPKLAPLELASPVYAKPDKQAEKIGYLRIGAQLARSTDAVSMRGCAGGWYAVRPLGFVCAGTDATIRLDDPLVRAIDVEPARDRALPYRYAFARSEVPNYMRVPTLTEQVKFEVGLEQQLRSDRGNDDPWSAWPGSANDVAPGGGAARAPEPARQGGLAVRAGGVTSSAALGATPWWLAGDRHIPNVAPFEVAPNALIARLAQRRAGVAVIGSFESDALAGGRRFAVTPDARLLPMDKLAPEAGSSFHGRDVRALGLPVAFGWRRSARFWTLEAGRLTPGASVPRRELVALTGVERVMGGEPMLEARDGRWLRSADLRVAAEPKELPWFAQRARRWVHVSLENQTLVTWEGDTPVYATLVSTGKDSVERPRGPTSTPRGTFRILQKHVTTTMDSDVADSEFELRDVPWVMYFKGGYALHGAYWHDDFGLARSHGCVNLSPIDARHVFEWSQPDVPEHWHGAYASEGFGSGTLVHIEL